MRIIVPITCYLTSSALLQVLVSAVQDLHPPHVFPGFIEWRDATVFVHGGRTRVVGCRSQRNIAIEFQPRFRADLLARNLLRRHRFTIDQVRPSNFAIGQRNCEQVTQPLQ